MPTKTLPRQNRSEQRQNYKRQPGHSDAERSLGSMEERVHKRLRTMDAGDEEKENADAQVSGLEHVIVTRILTALRSAVNLESQGNTLSIKGSRDITEGKWYASGISVSQVKICQ